MTEEKPSLKESRPMSANNPLRRQKVVKHMNQKRNLLSEEESEKLHNLTKNQKVYNLLNSPNKIGFLLDNKTIYSKNLFSEAKETKTKTRLPKIQSSTAKIATRKKIIIDANKINNNNINNDLINRKMENNIKELNSIRKNSFYKSKNNGNLNIYNHMININNKKKVKMKESNDNGINKDSIKNANNNKKNEDIKNINNKNDIINNNKEKKEQNKNKENNCNNIINNNINIINKNNNMKNNDYIEVNTKNSREKNVKFNKEVSIINIFKEDNVDNIEIIEKNNLSLDQENRTNSKNTTKDISIDNNKNYLNKLNNINNINNINIENTSIEVKFISNININTNNDNSNLNEQNNKYNNIVKNSANSNKNISEISEQINTNLSNSKLEPFPDVMTNNNNNAKHNCESSSDKNAFIQSLSNNIELDPFLHKSINCNTLNVYLGEIIYESPSSVLYKGIELNSGEILCVKRYIDKNNVEYKNEKELFDMINNRKNTKNDVCENLIKFLGYKTDEDNNFIFLEYASGDNLKKIIKLCGGTLNEKIIRNYTKQILLSLNYLHKELKVVHRDIKCSNILLDKDGIIKLIDFGCAGFIEKQNIENAKKPKENNNENENNLDINKPFFGFKGSLPWCAPEILNKQYYGTKCDIWSLGCAIIEMGGIEPWNNKLNGFYEYINVIGKSKEFPEIPKQFSYELKDFINRCLERDPDKRADADTLLNHFFITGEKFENKTIFL